MLLAAALACSTTLSARILDPAGTPARDVQVEVAFGKSWRAAGVTDSGGRIELEIDDEVLARAPFVAPTLVAWTKDALGATSLRSWSLDPAGAAPLEIGLSALVDVPVEVSPFPPGMSLEIRTLYLGGAAVDSPATFLGNPPAALDHSGRATVRVPASCERFELRGRSPLLEFGRWSMRVPQTGEAPLRVELPGAHAPDRVGAPPVPWVTYALELQLVGSDSAWAAERTVRVTPRFSRHFFVTEGRVEARALEVRTDATGRVRVDDSPAHTVALQLVVQPGDPDVLASALRPPSSMDSVSLLSEGGPVRAVMQLEPAPKAIGRVAAPGGLAGVSGVTLVIDSGPNSQRIVSGAGGHFEYLEHPSLQPAVEVEATPQGWRRPRNAIPRQTISQSWSVPSPLHLELAPERPVDIRVVDGTGRPLKGARVGAMLGVGFGYGRGLTDAVGRASFADVDARALDLTVERRGYVTTRVNRDVARSITVALEAEVRLPCKLRVVDDAGDPAAGVRVGLSTTTGRLDEGRTNDRGEVELAATSASDRFIVDWSGAGLAPGSAGLAADDLRSATVVVERRGGLRGTVESTDGAPVAGARVRHGEDLAETDERGRFEFREANLSRPILTVSAAGFRTGGAAALDANGEVVVRLLPQGASLGPAPPETWHDPLTREERRDLARELLVSCPPTDALGNDFRPWRAAAAALVDHDLARSFAAEPGWHDPLQEARAFRDATPPKESDDARWQLGSHTTAANAAARLDAVAADHGHVSALAHALALATQLEEAGTRAAVEDWALRQLPALDDDVAAERERDEAYRSASRLARSSDEAPTRPEPSYTTALARSWLATLEEGGAEASRVSAVAAALDLSPPFAPRSTARRDPPLPRSVDEALQWHLRTSRLSWLEPWLESEHSSSATDDEVLRLFRVSGSNALQGPHRPQLFEAVPALLERDRALALEAFWTALDAPRHSEYERQLACSCAAKLDATLARDLWRHELGVLRAAVEGAAVLTDGRAKFQWNAWRISHVRAHSPGLLRALARSGDAMHRRSVVDALLLPAEAAASGQGHWAGARGNWRVHALEVPLVSALAADLAGAPR